MSKEVVLINFVRNPKIRCYKEVIFGPMVKIDGLEVEKAASEVYGSENNDQIIIQKGNARVLGTIHTLPT